jgi:two-component system sensor histidine kinase BaeS
VSPLSSLGPGGALLGADLVAMQVMDDGPAVALFVSLVVAVSLVSALLLPAIFLRLPLRYGVPALALVGPALAIVGSLIGTGAMTLSGHDAWYSVLVAVCTGSAAIVVGFRLARPVARDLDSVAGTVGQVADGDRSARTGIDRKDEIGKLAAAVDEMCRSLARAETEREAADEERRSVVSALSHDLRTPLASLLVSVDALEDGIGDRGTHLRAMRGNVLALEALVGDLFLLARADSGNLALVSERLDLAELVDEAVEAVEPVALVKQVEVGAELDGPLPVLGDHGALGRVLRNLLDNAIRYSPDGGEVVVRAAGGEGGVRIEVSDDGTGFPDSFIPRAFDRFSQADDARSRPGRTGLGLAIARTLVEAHGGSIGVEPGPGGLVRIELPAADGDDGNDAGEAREAAETADPERNPVSS